MWSDRENFMSAIHSKFQAQAERVPICTQRQYPNSFAPPPLDLFLDEWWTQVMFIEKLASTLDICIPACGITPMKTKWGP
jgi:hypothetical protein